jgi:hypothetical protein
MAFKMTTRFRSNKKKTKANFLGLGSEYFELRSVRAPKLGDYIPQMKITTIMKDLQLKAGCRGIGWRYKKSETRRHNEGN